MEEDTFSESVAMTKELEGGEQIISLDSETLLCMIMKGLGSKRAPEFTENDCGAKGVMVTVRIDVSCARCYLGIEKPDAAVIDGEPNISKTLAEKSAVERAIKYLNDRHKVKIIDFSTKIVYGIEGNGAFGHVNALLYSLENVVHEWELTIVECKKLAIQLHAKDAESGGEEHSLQKWAMYGSLKEFMLGIVELYNERVDEAKAKATALDSMRRKYHERATERNNQDLTKGYIQTVFLPQKMILDCVLEYLGLPKAEYTNRPTTYGMMKGVASFYLPPVEWSDYCGNMQIKGKSRCSHGAEEDAAYQALLYIEQKRRLRVHDIYHGDRMVAEKEHKYVIRLLEQIVVEFCTVQRHWGKMVKDICKERKNYMNEAASVNKGEDNKKRVEAYCFCAEQIEHLWETSTKRFEECGERFAEMQNRSSKLEELKTEIELD